MPTLIRYFDPALELGIVQTSVNDLDDAIEHVLDDEQWVHATTGESCSCDTIVMWDEPNNRFYLYVELVPDSPHIFLIPSPQVDTYELSGLE